MRHLTYILFSWMRSHQFKHFSLSPSLLLFIPWFFLLFALPQVFPVTSWAQWPEKSLNKANPPLHKVPWGSWCFSSKFMEEEGSEEEAKGSLALWGCTAQRTTNILLGKPFKKQKESFQHFSWQQFSNGKWEWGYSKIPGTRALHRRLFTPFTSST